MKKKIYYKPEMEVVPINMNQSILAGSVQANGLSGYGGWGGVSDEEDEGD